MKQVVLLSVLSLFILTGCHNYGGGVIIGGGYSNGHNAPPAHAPAHGRRSHHRYHYYPNAEFYFDIGRNMYFYLDSRAQWSFAVTLPLHLRHHLQSNYVEIEMDDDRPYNKHKHHKNKYKKNKTKYNRKHKAKHNGKNDKKKYKYKERKKKHKKYDDSEEKERRHKKRKYDRE